MGIWVVHPDDFDTPLSGSPTPFELVKQAPAEGNYDDVPISALPKHMVHDVWRIEATHNEVVEDLRRARGERDDPRAVDLLGLLGLMMYGWIFGLCAVVHTDPAERRWAREELAWWVPRARHSLETWSP